MSYDNNLYKQDFSKNSFLVKDKYGTKTKWRIINPYESDTQFCKQIKLIQ